MKLYKYSQYMLKFDRENLMGAHIQGLERKQVDSGFALNKQARTAFKWGWKIMMAIECIYSSIARLTVLSQNDATSSFSEYLEQLN